MPDEITTPLLTLDHERRRREYDAFTCEKVVPFADSWDLQESLPAEVVVDFARLGYLGALCPQIYGGSELDAIAFGLLNESIGYGCSSLRSLLTVHSMVVYAIARWGDKRQKEKWLPELATGERIGAFALTEPDAGSDAEKIAATARPIHGGYLLDGIKRWVTYGQRADVFLAFARCAGKPTAFLVPRGSQGLEVIEMPGPVGTKASLLAELRLRQCHVSDEALLGRLGFGLTAVATCALDIGRYSVAWGCVGIIQSCLDLSAQHASEREQFGKKLREHQLVQQMLADMATNAHAARMLCLRAGWLKDRGDPDTVIATWVAKYSASRAAFQAAADAVQIHGALGCRAGHPAQRMLRDAKVMEIIEGSTQLQQSVIARAVSQRTRDGR
jgi:alkylation response protein AidB-like acyl-CoA dehydrogenase